MPPAGTTSSPSASAAAPRLSAYDEAVAGYLAKLTDAGLKAATIARRLVVISQAHKAADLPTPTTSSLVRRTSAGIRRSIGKAQTGKAPAVVTDLSACSTNCRRHVSDSEILPCCSRRSLACARTGHPRGANRAPRQDAARPPASTGAWRDPAVGHTGTVVTRHFHDGVLDRRPLTSEDQILIERGDGRNDVVDRRRRKPWRRLPVAGHNDWHQS